MTRYARKYRRISRSLSRVELMRGAMDDLSLSGRDLLDKDAGRRFLDFYGEEGIATALERYGIFAALRARGWDDFAIETTANDDRHTLLMDAACDGARERLMELVVRRDRLRIEGHERTWDVLTVDWLMLRDPRDSFTRERMRLPGQDAPGSGLGEQVLELLYRVVDRLSLEGFLTVAEYFHNAVLYARELPFVDPWYAGQLRALCDLLFEREALTFAQAAWAMHWGYVLNIDDSSVLWKGEAMIRAMEPELRARLDSPEHERTASHAERSLEYRLDRTGFDEQWSAEEASLLSPL